LKLEPIRQFALSLEAVTEEPHHHFSSFRVRGKIFVTIPPGEQFLHIFVDEQTRDRALVLHGEFIEKLFWGGKVVGLKVSLSAAKLSVVKRLVKEAYHVRANKDAKPK
jgi:hypothetical protein